MRGTNDGITIMIGEDGVAREYNDTYDITIHCESEEEQRQAIEIINQYDMNFHWNDGEPIPAERLEEAFDLAISALEKQEQDRWIPCSVRLPKEKDAGILKKLGTNKRSDYVLATIEVKGERMTVTACTYDGKWDWNMKYAFPDYKVIAWMSLPKPYTEEEA